MPKDLARSRVLKEIANIYHIQTSYLDVFKHRKVASDQSLICALQAMRVPIKEDSDLAAILNHTQHQYWQQKLEPCIVAWNGILTISCRLTQSEALRKIVYIIECENGEQYHNEVDLAKLPCTHEATVAGKTYVIKTIRVKQHLPLGYHDLKIEMGSAGHRSFILSAPRQLYQQDDQKIFGLFTPIYALHSQHSLGCGDLTDFKNFITWSAQLQSQLIGTLPLHATFLDQPFDPSPYSAISRLFWNELYLDPRQTVEFENEVISAEFKVLNNTKEVEYKKIMALRRPLLKKLADKCFSNEARRQELQKYLLTHPLLEDYARFRTLNQQLEQPWWLWTQQQKESLSQSLSTNSDYHYYLYTQWQTNLQLAQLVEHSQKNHVKLYFDLPLGVHRQGFDAWYFQNDFALEANTGAPPDAVFTGGQNWHTAPLHPIAIRQSRYRYLIASLRSIMQKIDLLRIDHVMGLHRLYWIPVDCEPANGVYVNYNADEFYAILALESHRQQVGLIGENLGTVPNFINQTLRKHALYEMYVLQYELDSHHKINLQTIPAKSIASLNTHDMPTFAAYNTYSDLELRQQLKLLTHDVAITEHQQRASRIKALEHTLISYGMLDQSNADSNYALLIACLLLLARSDAQYLLINVEDLWSETIPQNIPTAANMSWRHKLRYSLEEIKTLEKIKSLINEIGKARQNDIEIPIKTVVKPSTQPSSRISNEDIHWFNEGTHFRLYEKLGAHLAPQQGVHFAVWAPNAKYVAVIGDFNQWNKKSHPLQPRASSGIWEGYIPEMRKGDLYKYFIHSHHHDYAVEKADPFGFYHEIAPKTASIVWDLDYSWQDQAWLEKRHRLQNHQSPIAVYEMHIGSWQRMPEQGHRFLTYREIAPRLINYVKKMGYTHVELLPIMEHPYYESWGYQILGYFAPTSRYGSPQDFMYLIDQLHQNDIGVIVDWVPSHFPTDQHGLNYFDGTHLFDHADRKKGFHPDWTSAIFNYGRNEVRAFLISSALFWLDKYHIDGIRVDAVASMLYLDYSRKEGEWIPNQFGGRENLEAIHFLRQLNEQVYLHYPDVQTIAEESTAWGGVSRPTYLGGLGFGFKWDMGWMHDILHYLGHDPIYRSYHQNELTFRMLYAFTENFMLPLSHDEVVHGKGSLLCKMPGSDWDKFANVRLLLGCMYAQPGKKLLFMGSDFGQWHEWNCQHSLDWHLLNYAPHQGLAAWVQKLNYIYRQEPALYQLDFESAGFEWIDCNDHNHSVLTFIRKSIDAKEMILIVVNATPMTWHNYRVGTPAAGQWREIANSDDVEFGGSGQHNKPCAMSEEFNYHGRPWSINITIPPLSVCFYKHI